MSQKKSLFEGVITALVTPFKRDGSIDWDAYSNLVGRQIRAGVTAVVPSGTTGESPTLTHLEKETLIKRTVELCKGTHTRVLAGTGSNSTASSVELSRFAALNGVDGVLLVVPYYNKPTQAGLLAHFSSIAEAVPSIEVMLYNVPGRTITALESSTVATLSKLQNIRSLKEATGDLEVLKKMQTALQETGESMNLLSGDDPTYLPFLQAGGHGVVSVISNLLPQTAVSIYTSFKSGDSKTSEALFKRTLPLCRDLFVEPNPVPIKFALHARHLCEAMVRLPLLPCTKELQRKLTAHLADLEDLK